jgi:GGDEF domain-containing protein
LTGFIARQINYGLREFEDVITDISFGQIGSLPKSFSEVQSSMYREVRRARRYQRPLSVVTLKIDEQSIQVALPKMIEAIQQEMMREYVFANVSRVLDENVDDFGTIALRDDCFIVVLPEKTPNEASAVAQRLEKVVREKIDVKLQTGMANFPDEAITFEELVNLAVQNVDQKVVSQQQEQAKQSVPEKPKQGIIPQEG